MSCASALLKTNHFFTATKGTKPKKRTSTAPVNIKVKNKKPKTNLLITNPEEQDQNLTAKGTNKIRIGKNIKLTIKYESIQEYEEDIGTNISYTFLIHDIKSLLKTYL